MDRLENPEQKDEEVEMGSGVKSVSVRSCPRNENPVEKEREPAVS